MERPPVTIGTPARPAPEPDLLVGGEGTGLGPVGRRRLRLLVALGLAAAAGAVVTGEVREQRAAAAEQRRAAGALELSLQPVRALEQWARYDEVGQTAELDVPVHVRNDGPRGVRLIAGALGPYSLPGEVDVPPGEVAELVLQRSVSCTAAPPEPTTATGLELQARTGAGVRRTTLPVDLVVPADAARRACGLVPFADAVTVRYADRQQRDQAFDVGLEVRTATREPMRLDEVRTADGLTAVLLGPDGEPGPPLPWPMQARSRLQVRLAVADCAAAARAGAQPLLHLLLQDGAGATATSDLPDGDVRAALLASACGP